MSDKREWDAEGAWRGALITGQITVSLDAPPEFLRAIGEKLIERSRSVDGGEKT